MSKDARLRHPGNVMRARALAFGVLAVAILFVPALSAQAKVTSPQQQFGFNIGDDYQLVNYQQLLAYWKKLAAESDRMTLVDIGRTAEGRPMVMAIITSPANHARLERYKEIAGKLALAKGVGEAEARRLAAEGKAVVWIDGGLHATEILGSQQLIELVYQMTDRSDPETLRILDDVILLAVPANPDGLDLVADWYMRNPEPSKRSTSGIPRLYQKYIGHDNNRDFYMNAMPETKAMSRQLYREWHPQILYNHHQTGPSGTVLFAPPFRDPFNYVFDPLIPMGLDLVCASIHNRFVTEDKPGATMRSGAGYSTWWNGGLRSTGYFHNVIGILTETIGSPTPMEIPFVPQRLLPRQDYPYPIKPQAWHFRQSIDYSITADKAILDVASKHREDFLYRRWLMGKNAVEKGSRDSWTVVPAYLAEVETAVANDRPARPDAAAARGGFGGRGGVDRKYYDQLFDPAKRDPRGYILPADQPDFPTATKFVNALIESGCEVLRATADFAVAGKSYPKGSYVLKTDHAFRGHVLTMFEPQDHPHDVPYPGGPPTPPYDSAGWTLAYQMGVVFDRVLEGFDGPFLAVPDVLAPPAGVCETAAGAAGWLLAPQANDAFVAVNRVLKAGGRVLRAKASFEANGRARCPGTWFFPAGEGVAAVLETAAREKGLRFESVSRAPAVETTTVTPRRIGLWDTYGGSMPSGWTRWILEQFEFPFELVFAPALDAGDLNAKFDVLIFVGGAIPSYPAREAETAFRGGQTSPESVPEEFRNRIGRVTAEQTLPKLREFVERGGIVAAIGSSTSLGYHFGLPVSDFLVEKSPEGGEQPLRSEKYYVPGSILRARVDPSQPLAFGMADTVDVFFNRSPVFMLMPGADLQGVRPVAWFDDGQLLRSGWVWGEAYLRRGVVAVDAAVGKGRLFLFGPEIAFRAQPHGTFKLLFNGIYY